MAVFVEVGGGGDESAGFSAHGTPLDGVLLDAAFLVTPLADALGGVWIRGSGN